MDTSALEIFRAVAQASGVTRAAIHLGRVASNVSTHIGRLERELRTPLFVRSNTGMSLTREGEIFLDYANRILGTWDEARTAVGNSGSPRRLRLGVTFNLASARTTAALAAFGTAHPECEVAVRSGTCVQLAAAVLAGELDGAFVSDGVPLDGLDELAADEQTLVLVGPPGWRGMPHRTAVVFDAGCPYRERLEAWYRRRHSAPLQHLAATTFEFVLSCAAAGSGISVIPTSVLARFPPGIGIRPLPRDLETLAVRFTWARARPPQALLDSLDTSCLSPTPRRLPA